MNDAMTEIAEHMEVVGSCGHHVGTVDHVEGDRIKLTRKDDPDGGDHHHFLPLTAVKVIENGKVVLQMNHKEALAARTM